LGGDKKAEVIWPISSDDVKPQEKIDSDRINRIKNRYGLMLKSKKDAGS